MIEEDLRRVLNSPERTPPMWSDPVARVRDGMRRRTRRTIAVASALLVMAVGLGAAALLSRPPAITAITADRADGIVPWVDTPAERRGFVLSAGPTPSPLGPGPSCVSKNLARAEPRVTYNVTDAQGTFWAVVAVRVRNVGSDPCTLSGHPQIRVADDEGKPIGETLRAGGKNFAPYATIRPGDSAQSIVTYPVLCPGPPVEYRALEVDLGELRFVVNNFSITTTCAPVVGDWWRDDPAEYTRFQELDARIVAPSTVTAGTDLVYTLELTNVTDTVVSMRPCLVFAHWLWAADQVPSLVVQQLNCGPAAILAHQTVRYEIRLPVPAETIPGSKQLQWNEAGGLARAAVTVEVTSAGR